MSTGICIRKRVIVFITLYCSTFFALTLQAGESSIAVSATSTVRYDPDTAEFTATLSAIDKDATKAAARVATQWSTLRNSLHQAGIPAADAVSASYSVNPEWEWVSSSRSRVFKGYTARHLIRVTVRELHRLGGVIDASVGAGAGNVEGLRYSSSRFPTYRSQALESAVRSARHDAEVMAAAAGGRLGSLLELEYGQPQPAMPLMRMAMADGLQAAPATEIQPGEQELTVSVNSRWQFMPGGGR
ncbi:MAG: SIMPL domain-containing protein [Chlorobiaceae bacterium]|nr:SIMPL domain-containing protein [Chlorobiaceae bacterium]